MHKPLPEQYIWTKSDAVPEDSLRASGWTSDSGSDLAPHYFRRSFKLASPPAHATLSIAGPRSATVFLNGQQICSYQLDTDSPMGIRVRACDVTAALRPGRNVVALEAVRGPGMGSGADSRLSIQQTRGELLAVKIVPAERGVAAAPLLISDGQWKASMQHVDNWQNAAFDDRGWPDADSLGGIESSIEFFQWNADAGMCCRRRASCSARTYHLTAHRLLFRVESGTLQRLHTRHRGVCFLRAARRPQCAGQQVKELRLVRIHGRCLFKQRHRGPARPCFTSAFPR